MLRFPTAYKIWLLNSLLQNLKQTKISTRVLNSYEEDNLWPDVFFIVTTQTQMMRKQVN